MIPGSSRQQGGRGNGARAGVPPASISNPQSHLSIDWTARTTETSSAGNVSAPSQSASQSLATFSLDNLAFQSQSSPTSLGRSSLFGSFTSLLSKKSSPTTPTSTSASGSGPTSASGSKSTETSSSSTSKFKRAAAVTCGKLETALRGLQTTANLLPPIRSVIDEIIECLGGLQTIVQTEDVTQLEREVQSMIETLDGFLKNLNPEEDNALLEDIMLAKAKIENIDKTRGHTKGKRLLDFAKYEQDIFRCSVYIKDLIQQLQSKTILQTWHSTNRHYTLQLLRNLSPAHDALYNSDFSKMIKRHGCTPQTREKIQEDLHNWVRDDGAASFYWMNGMAGTGKTTIAYSLCDWLKDQGLLGASFFCSGSQSSCRNAGKIIPTIAYQLAQNQPRFRPELCKVLEEEPNIVTSDITRQLEKLLVQPWMPVKNTIQGEVVVVIDALDEWDERGCRSRMREFFEALLKFATRLPLKFFVTSRPDSALHDQLLSKAIPPAHPRPTVRLHEIEQSLVERDIAKYLTVAFAALSPPPPPDQIDFLAKRAGKLFICAATVVHFVMSDTACGDPNMRLNSILSIPQEDRESYIKYKELDRLYTKILSIAFSELIQPEKENREAVLWTPICAEEPVTIDTLASLADRTQQQVISALQPLQSVLYISEDGSHVSPLHSSFLEFMLDRARSRKYYLDRSKHSLLIAKCCLEVMKNQLTFNICRLESSFLFDRDIPDLEDRISEHIPPILYYACSYWGTHLRLSRTSDTLSSMVADFLSHGLLFWMEVLNLKGCMNVGPEILLQAQDWFLHLW
ncbi:unnamed protein product [Rhizoctonia solani]|uniref:Nephrocystin 3-like N-terminal domain-containing protein n=1 Tax=Rhizoctonia solani TaxID=456999 RepID=A0A8H3GK89_9AGAM|nr:unnamed protein product [Rhizoctonia solani]